MDEENKLHMREEYTLKALKKRAYAKGEKDEQGRIYFYMTRKELAQQLGVSKPTVMKSLHILIEQGILKEDKRPGEQKTRLILTDEIKALNKRRTTMQLDDTEREIIIAYRKNGGNATAINAIMDIILQSYKEKKTEGQKIVNITEHIRSR